MNRIFALFFYAAVIISTACSDNVPLFRDLHKGRADVLDRLVITPGAVTLSEQAYVMLNATGYYNDGTSADLSDECEWTCDDQQVAVVSGAGYVQARALVGFANVSARHGDLRSTVPVTVDIRLASLTITPNTTVLRSTNQVYFAASGRTTDGTVMDLTKTVSWVVTPFTKAEMDGSGMFMARETEGTVTVTAKSPDGSITSNAATVELDLTTLYVDAAFVTEAGNGTKEKPFATISQGIARAEQIGAVRINVAKGTYTEDVIIKKNISLYGGYVANYSGAEWTRAATVVPGETVIRAKGNTAILYNNGLTQATVLDGFRVIGNSAGVMESGMPISTSSGIRCSDASPTIRNCEIFGGKAGVVTYGIMIQTSAAHIENSYISGGLEGYAGGGVDNIAVLAQNSSTPVISGNTITGPSGGESTYRIKCESSSNATIQNNSIETTISGKIESARGVLAINSSPVISSNVISSYLFENQVIRGENTSFKIVENTLLGSVCITSGSVNPTIDGNSIVKGGISVSGASVGVTIRGHAVRNSADPNFIQHYGIVVRKIIEGVVEFDGSSSGSVQDSCVGEVVIKNNSYLHIHDNVILAANSKDSISISAGGFAKIYRNLIVNSNNAAWNISGIRISNNVNPVEIYQNIICVGNVNVTTKENNVGISSDNSEGAVYVVSNLIYIDSASLLARNIGVYAGHVPSKWVWQFWNNAVVFNRGTQKCGFYFDQTVHPPLFVCGNYFVGQDQSFSGAFSAVSGSNINTMNGDPLSGGSFDFNSDVSVENCKWVDYIPARVGIDMIKNNFYIRSDSALRNAGVDSRNYEYGAGTELYMTPDFDSKPRNIGTGTFSVGPYEYVP